MSTSFRIRRVLVAIREEHGAPRAALRKAAALGRATGARIELFHAINEPQAVDTLRRGLVHGLETRQIIQAVTERAEKRLARLAAHRDFAGLKVTVSASWDYPPHEAIIRQAMAIDADLILASVQPKAVAGRLLLANTDWELIRHAPCPVLLVKSPRLWKKRPVLAAVDPFHAHDKPAALDQRILEAGRYLSEKLGGGLNAVHAYMPLTLVAPAPAGQPLALTLPPEAEAVHTTQVAQGVERVTAKFAIPPRRRRIELGTPADALARVAREIDAGIVVAGAVSRSAWRRFVIGSTAERLLDRVESDLLIVKPRDFRARIPRRATLAWLQG